MNSRSSIAWTTFGVLALLWAVCVKPSLRLVYNASDSAPRGLYTISMPTGLRLGDYVVARLPEGTARLAAARGYLPRSVPVLKRIAAVAGQRVCIRNESVFVDGVAVARTLGEDGKHRPLAPWKHCRSLVEGELFLLNPGNPDSFDSRYFGPIDVSFVRGKAMRM